MITISRLYDDYGTAARAFNDLERAGIPKSDISIVANNSEGWYEHGREPGRIDRDGDGVDDRTEARLPALASAAQLAASLACSRVSG